MMIRTCFLLVGMSTSNRIIKPGYEFYQPVVAARQFGLGQVPPHFFLHYLTISRADLPDILTSHFTSNPCQLIIHFFGHRLRELMVNVEDSCLSESLGANAAAN
jgi:hypothetical protein